MDIDYTVGEVELSYKPKFKSLHQVTCSEDAYKYSASFLTLILSLSKNVSYFLFDFLLLDAIGTRAIPVPKVRKYFCILKIRAS